MWAGWSVLKLFVVGEFSTNSCFYELFKQPVKLKSCLLPVLSTSQHHAQNLWCLCVFCWQAGWELMPVCEKWIAFVGVVRVPNCIFMCSRCSSMIPCEWVQCKVWTLVAHPHPEGGVASSWKMPSCPCGFGLVWLFTLCVLHTGCVVMVFYLLPSFGLITASSLRSFIGLLALDQVCEATMMYKPLLLPRNFQSLLGSPACTEDLAKLDLRQVIQ